MRNDISILNCSLNNVSNKELLSNFDSGVLMPTNVDMIVKLQKDKEFYDCYQNAEIRVNDSKIINLAAKFLGTPLKDTVSGSDFFPLFYNYHKKNRNVTIFLLGAEEGVAEIATIKINKKVGREMVVGCYSPPFGFEKNEKECFRIIEKINASKATVLAVGLGAPKQEKWVTKYRNQLEGIKQILCIGATIDFEAGKVNRAPKWIRVVGFEWLYRLFKEPKRLWRRYLIDDIPFLFLLLQQKFGFYKNPFSGTASDN